MSLDCALASDLVKAFKRDALPATKQNKLNEIFLKGCFNVPIFQMDVLIEVIGKMRLVFQI